MGRLSAAIQGGQAATGYFERPKKKGGKGPRVEVEISSNVEHVIRGLEDLMQYQRKHRDEVRKAHKLVAASGRRKLRQGVKDYPREIVVKRGETEYRIPPGTLRRSIAVFRPNDNQTNWWLGPKTGLLKSGKPRSGGRDGWFAHFVEGGDSPFLDGGTNTNYRWFERARPAAVRNMQRNLARQHGRLLKELYGAK